MIAYQTRYLLIALGLCMLSLAACQAPPVVTDLEAYDFEDPTAPTTMPPPASLYTLKSDSIKLMVTAGDGVGEVVNIDVTKVNDDADFPYRRALPGDRIEHVGYAADGSIIVGAVEDLSHNVITYFDPPMPLLPVNLKPDEPQSFKSKMKIVSRKNPQMVTDTGEASKTITHDADQTVVTPVGKFKAYRVHATYTAVLKTARVQTAEDAWYNPKLGLVAERDSETVTALILQWTNKKTIIRSQR
ncbi:hypothetical protein HED60_01920 [Planctomycetales bacterium ZRK34]|nr:hypothetical protein HED60_01920 [Planctomycetales bacterium ZRK34]